MSHSLARIWIHAIWSTKDRLPLIHPNAEQPIYKFLEEEFQEMGCSVKAINGMADHIHVLFLLNPQKSIAEIIKQAKGSSSHYINQENLIPEKFSWQTGYAVFSVSGSFVEKVSLYIETQKEHHAKKSFLSEFNEILIAHGFEIESPTHGLN